MLPPEFGYVLAVLFASSILHVRWGDGRVSCQLLPSRGAAPDRWQIWAAPPRPEAPALGGRRPACGALLALLDTPHPAPPAPDLLQALWMPIRVGRARKLYKIAYPTMYAPATHKHAKEFNCVQRAHQNCLEGLPTFLALLIVAGQR